MIITMGDIIEKTLAVAAVAAMIVAILAVVILFVWILAVNVWAGI